MFRGCVMQRKVDRSRWKVTTAEMMNFDWVIYEQNLACRSGNLHITANPAPLGYGHIRCYTRHTHSKFKAREKIHLNSTIGLFTRSLRIQWANRLCALDTICNITTISKHKISDKQASQRSANFQFPALDGVYLFALQLRAHTMFIALFFPVFLYFIIQQTFDLFCLRLLVNIHQLNWNYECL